MAEKIIMPQLGESIAEGTIVKWLKSVNDPVEKDENLLLISTDKVEAEIPSPAKGILLSIMVETGQTVLVGTVLGYVGQQGEQTGDAPAKKEEKKPEPAVTPKAEPTAKPINAPAPTATIPSTTPQKAVPTETPTTPSSEAFLSPLVRRISSDQGIGEAELRNIEGTGLGGRVTKKDLQQYIETGRAQQQAPKAPATPPTVQIPSGERETFKPVSTMRRVIMQNMIASKATSAHVTTFFEIDYTKIDQVRTKHKDRFKAEEGVPLTYTGFIAAAVCQTLKRHPYINAEIQGDKIKFKKDIHLGIAVAISDPEPGLMVPVIKNADQMNLRGLSHSIVDLSERVRNRRVKPDELSGGSFTITNPGNYGAIIGTPIINQPQVAILGVGKIGKQAVVKEVDGTDVIAIRNMGWLSLAFDHRLIDGATADIFMADLKETLETWTETP